MLSLPLLFTLMVLPSAFVLLSSLVVSLFENKQITLVPDKYNMIDTDAV
jgi:hypothetical protein